MYRPRSCTCTRYTYTLYPVNAGLSIKVNVHSLRSFRAILSRKCEMNGSPGSRRHQLIPGSYRPFSHSYTAVYGSLHVRLYMRVKLVDINMGNWTTGTRGNRKDMLAKGRMGVCPVANIEGGWLMASFYVPRDLLTALSWADWQGASINARKGSPDALGVG